MAEGGWWGWIDAVSEVGNKIIQVVAADLSEFSTTITDDTKDAIEVISKEAETLLSQAGEIITEQSSENNSLPQSSASSSSSSSSASSSASQAPSPLAQALQEFIQEQQRQVTLAHADPLETEVLLDPSQIPWRNLRRDVKTYVEKQNRFMIIIFLN